jgi:hypothetical protein
MNIKTIVYTALLAGFAMGSAQIYAQLPRDPQEVLRELGHTPGMKAKEEKEKAKQATNKELSIVNEKVIILAEELNQAKKQQNNDQIALNDCYAEEENELKKLYFFQRFFQPCKTDCSALAINYCGYPVDKEYWTDPYAKDLGGSYNEYIQAKRQYDKAFFDYDYFKSQNSKCNTVDCFNSLLEKLQKWNQEN